MLRNIPVLLVILHDGRTINSVSIPTAVIAAVVPAWATAVVRMVDQDHIRRHSAAGQNRSSQNTKYAKHCDCEKYAFHGDILLEQGGSFSEIYIVHTPCQFQSNVRNTMPYK